ncbi:5-hydroxytryptamine receptor 2A-like [Sergentomyia squamirostris]
MNELFPSWWPWSRPDDSPAERQNENTPSSSDDTDQAPIWRLQLYNGLSGLLTNISTSISGTAEHGPATKSPIYITSSRTSSSASSATGGLLFDAVTPTTTFEVNLTGQSVEWTYLNCTRYCDTVSGIVNGSISVVNGDASAVGGGTSGVSWFNRTDFFAANFGSEALITMIVTAIILGFVILATVIGNVFVIAAILLERNLQSVANYLILSLAVADLLVACLVMPLSAVYEVSQEWRLGAELCDMWTSSDVLCCTASILHLVAIALDRYWAVTDIDYAHQRTARRIGVMILVVWILSFLVSVAPLLGWKDPDWSNRLNNEYKCMVSQDVGYQIFATASSFYLPLLVILVLYWRIFQTARKRIRRRQQNIINTFRPKNVARGRRGNLQRGSKLRFRSGFRGEYASIL